MAKILNIPQAIYLYDEGIKDIDFKELKGFIKEHFGNIKVNLVKLRKEAVQTNGLLLDFLATQRNFEKLEHSNRKNSCYIILTRKLFATPDMGNRLHIRASIYGAPSVISTSGIVEGPAKPKEYYIYKQKYSQLGLWEIKEEELKRKFKGRFVEYQDRRLTGALKGYIAQALFFYLTGEPFCQKKNCRLYNAHWQEELIYAQIKVGRFCVRHKKILKELIKP